MKSMSNNDAINKQESQPINTIETYAHIHAGFISISVKMGGTSSSIPHRLNNSRWSASLLHIKKQCTAWVFEWAVERKTAVSCQGEHPEIISIIYRADIQQKEWGREQQVPEKCI